MKKDPEIILPLKGRKKSGGKRPGAGRPPSETKILQRGLRQLIDQHCNEHVMVEIVDPVTGQMRNVEKPRSIIMLELLYSIAHEESSVAAIKEWFDRAVGKAPQPIRGDGDEDAPVKLEIDIRSILNKAYGDNDA